MMRYCPGRRSGNSLVFIRSRAGCRESRRTVRVCLVLAAVGVYGVTAYMVAQQTNEICIQMALGADRIKVIHLVLRRAFSAWRPGSLWACLSP